MKPIKPSIGKTTEPRLLKLGRVSGLFPKRVYGYDFFISYARSDASGYAFALDKSLTRRGFYCFYDRRENPPGEKLWLQKALKKSSALILVGSPASLESQFVLQEVEGFAPLRRRIVPIDVGQTISKMAPTHSIKAYLKGDVVWASESLDHLLSGPSSEVLEDLESSFTYRRESAKRLRFLTQMSVLLFMLLIAAIGFGFLAEKRRSLVIRERDEANARRLAMEARMVETGKPQRRLLLGVASVLETWVKHGGVVVAAENELRHGLTRIQGKSLFRLSNLISVQFNRTGDRALVGKANGEVELFELPSGKRVSRHADHQNMIVKVRFFDNDNFAMSLDLFGTVYLWDLIGTPAKLAEEEVLMRCFASDRTGKKLVLSNGNGEIQVHDLRFQTQDDLPFQGSAVEDLALLEGGVLFSADREGRLLQWDLKNPSAKPKKILDGSSPLRRITLSHNGAWLACGGGAGKIDLIRLATAENGNDHHPRKTLVSTSGSPIGCLAFSHDDRQLVVGSLDGLISIWDLHTRETKPKMILEGHESDLLAVWLSPNRDVIISVCRNGEFRWYDLALNSEMAEPKSVHTNPERPIFSVRGNDRSVCVSGLPEAYGFLRVTDEGFEKILTPLTREPLVLAQNGDGSRVFVYDPEQKKIDFISTVQPLRPQSLLSGVSGEIVSAAVSISGRFAAIGWDNGELALWDFRQDHPEYHLIDKQKFGIQEIFFSAEDHWLLSLSRDTIQVFSLREKPLMLEPKPLAGVNGPARSAAVDAQGHSYAYCDEEGAVFLWDLQGNSPTRIFNYDSDPDRAPCYAVALSPDGRYLAAGGQKTKVRLWKRDRGLGFGAPLELQQPGGGILSLAFSSDGRWLATSSTSHETVRLWDLKAPNFALEPRLFPTGQNFVTKVAFAGRDQFLVTRSASGKVCLWTLSTEVLLRSARQRLGRAMTEDEWARYFPNRPQKPLEKIE